MMTSESLEAWIVQRLSKALGIKEAAIDPATPFVRLGIDSMVLIGFAAELEKYLERELDPQVLFDHSSPRSLARHLSKGT
ncbi:hypothetical protein BH10PLA2_BH10PLA2_12610 [soil metagenome]